MIALWVLLVTMKAAMAWAILRLRDTGTSTTAVVLSAGLVSGTVDLWMIVR